ncbi:hypothetical protein F5X68DRAFT_257436 [Plectosphaerella plurivora]|uniref:Uncharacterized protein n=1 Tax=Plectosphaerella plurivora TaxID=936078 RepID=A0A9P8VLR1_9PEZI|nr:hypothetical protein F5X68DRAFT_257436 [Plectosphaerella plurivora]
MSSPKQKTVLVTGCTTGGAGHALALEFASRGMRVFATARSTTSMKTLEGNKNIETLALDVTSAESIAALVREISKRTGGSLDILFNNAGSLYQAPCVESDPAQVRSMFNANVFGLFDMISAFTPLLLVSAAANGPSHPPTIINTASILSKMPYPFSAAYNASKAAVVSYSDALRIELAPLGIKVVTLYMGVVTTGLYAPVKFDPEGLYPAVEAGIEKRGQHNLDTGTSAEGFAKMVVADIVAKPGMGKGEALWKGANAFAVWLMSVVAPASMFTSVAEKGAGMTTEVKKAISDRGRAAAQKKL